MRISKILCIAGLLSGLVTHSQAVTTVNAGSISNVTGPGSLTLTNNLYAVNFNQEFGNQTVNAVTFIHDATPPVGFSSVGPQLVTNWQTKPEFGTSPSETALEEIYSDIRWTNYLADPNLQANMNVTAGQQYRLQILFYGNHAADTRGWDIGVEGAIVVDNITSLGVDTGGGLPAYSLNRGLVYTYDFLALDSQVNVVMGQLGGAPLEQTDGNAIWQGIMLSQIPEPTSPLLGGVAALALLRRRRSAA